MLVSLKRMDYRDGSLEIHREGGSMLNTHFCQDLQIAVLEEKGMEPREELKKLKDWSHVL